MLVDYELGQTNMAMWVVCKLKQIGFQNSRLHIFYIFAVALYYDRGIYCA